MTSYKKKVSLNTKKPPQLLSGNLHYKASNATQDNVDETFYVYMDW